MEYCKEVVKENKTTNLDREQTPEKQTLFS